MLSQSLARVRKLRTGWAENHVARKSTRPPELLYAVDETPPRTIMVISALQHVAVNSITLVFPLIIAREAGLPPGQLVEFVSLSMLAMGISTILLCARWRFAGCGYLCPAGFSQIYVGPSLFAVHLGGLPLAFGMTALAGILQFAIAPLLHRLRALLPTEIAGLVIAIVGLSLAIYGIQFMLGITSQHEVRPIYLVISGFTLVTMVVLNIWTKGYTKLFSVLIGVVAGYAASAFAGALDISRVIPEGGLAILHLPHIANFGWRFDATLLAPFAVAALATTLRTMGDVSNAQRLNDRDWVRPKLGSLTGGVAANGLATLFSGLMGSTGVNSNSSSVGLSGAMGITSRSVGLATGIIFVLLSIVPLAGVGFAAMPVPVMGASLFFTSAFVFTSGLQMITARLLDARKILVIGFSFAMAVMADVYREVFATLPAVLQPIFENSLVLGTVCAVLLNLVMRIGVRQHVTLKLDTGHVSRDTIERFLTEQGGRWGARRDIINRAIFGVVQLLEVVGDVPEGTEVEASFDEFNLDVRIRYKGAPLIIPERKPTPREIIASEEGERLLAGYLLRQSADRINCKTSGTIAEVQLHYDH
jgi:NCS2 family nucleobase:cation symporter-2